MTALADRLLDKIEEDANGCWLWTAYTASNGYARISVARSKSREAHRVSYELFVGPVPEGLQLDHLCRVRHCINPDHLEPVTSRTNLLRGIGPTAQKAAQTHCTHDHEFTPDNTYYRKARPTTRACRACRREATRRTRAAA